MPITKKQTNGKKPYSNALQKRIDEALKESFPASDSPARIGAHPQRKKITAPSVILKDKVFVEWKRKGSNFDYEKYNRDAKLTFGGGKSITVSNPPQYFGDAKYANSEELFIAALACCYMQTFLAVASKQGYNIKQYQDEAVGLLGHNSKGKLGITDINLNLKVKFEGIQPSKSALDLIKKSAHDHCFIANSSCSKLNITIKLVK
jgi:organic hydroperoxide reductase OsmC/OhrA